MRKNIERNNYIEAVASSYHVGYEDLRKLGDQDGNSAGACQASGEAENYTEQREGKGRWDFKISKILLTWLIEDEAIFRQIERYITPEDFSEGLYRKVAELVYEQYREHTVNPAQIMNHFTDEEEHREVAGLFHTKIKELTTVKEQEKALMETVVRVKSHSIEEATRHLDATDISGLQRLMDAKRKLQDLQKLHISIN